MKVSKMLENYIQLKVCNAIPTISAHEKRVELENLIQGLHEEFTRKVNDLAASYIAECEKEHPVLKKICHKVPPIDLWTTYGSEATIALDKLERSDRYRRECVVNRIKLTLELSKDDLSLDTIDEIIIKESEVFKGESDKTC